MFKPMTISLSVLSAAVLLLDAGGANLCCVECRGGESSPDGASAGGAKETPPPKIKLPRLVDLGAKKCIPCKQMAPILEELKKDYGKTFDVVFIDVWEKPEEGGKYGISSIPTQIFYDADGKELFRHEGFFPKDEILKKWRELGVGVPDGGEPKN